jgi:hypothetical protein
LYLILKTGAKIAVAALTALGLYKGIAFFRKAGKIGDNLTVNAAPKSFSFVNFSTVKTLISASLNNYSGFNLNVNNVYSKLFLVSPEGAKSEAGISSVIPEITFSNNQTKSFDLAFNFSYLTIVGQILTGKVKEIELVTYYDFKGQQLQYTSKIDFAAFVSKAKAFITGSNTVKGVGVGML